MKFAPIIFFFLCQNGMANGPQMPRKLAVQIQKTFPLSSFIKETEFHEDVRKLFKKHAKDQRPTSIRGDFDGDGRSDDAVVVFRREKEMVAILALDKGAYEFHKIDSWGLKEISVNGKFMMYVSKFPRTKVRRSSPKQPIRDVFQLEYYLGATTGYYFSQGKVQQYKGLIKE